MTTYIVANWKLNGQAAFAKAYLESLQGLEIDVKSQRIVVCPPAPLLEKMAQQMAQNMGSPWLFLGAQDCSAHDTGAFTGQISAPLLKQAGAAYVIVGHSECRQYLQDTEPLIQAKLIKAQQAGLTPIYCVGEPLEARELGKQNSHVLQQLQGGISKDLDLKNLLIAYEPLWAIGTGKIPPFEAIEEIHQVIKNASTLLGAPVPVLYGGSVKADNAAQIAQLPWVDGVLVGGASLEMKTFLSIVGGCFSH